MSQRGSFNPNFLVFVILIIVLNSTSSNTDSPALEASHQAQVLKDSEKLAYLRNTTFLDRSNLRLNGTIDAVRIPDSNDLILPYDREFDKPIYANSSGNLRGSWHSDHEATLTINATQKSFVEFFSNTHGKLTATIDDYALTAVNASRARIDLKFTSRNGWRTNEFVVEGVHLADKGELLLAADQRNTHGVFFTPMLTTSNETFTRVKSAADEVLERRIDAIRVPDHDQEHGCDIMILAQIHRLDGTPEDLKLSEAEYQKHTGRPFTQLQPISISGHFFSPNCGLSVLFELKGIRDPQLQQRAQRHAVFFIGIVILQIYTMIVQMRETSAPSNLWRVSFWSIAAQCLLDGYNAVILLICGLSLPSGFVPMIAASFLAFLCMALYGLRYLLLIYRMQRQFIAAASDSNGSPTPEAQVESEVVEARTMTEGEIERRDLSTLYMRFYFSLLALLFLSLQVAYLPNSLRDVLTGFGLLIINSYWIPQIYRQAVLGYRSALSMKFVGYITACRLVPVLYVYAWPTNVLLHEQDWYIVLAIISYSWVQIIILIGQNLFGPRFFLPKSDEHPEIYDYHSLPTQDLESATEGFDNLCAVCMSALDLPQADSNTAASILSRRAFMRTPCNHFFHTACLRQWMQRRLKCPICRAVLPPD